MKNLTWKKKLYFRWQQLVSVSIILMLLYFFVNRDRHLMKWKNAAVLSVKIKVPTPWQNRKTYQPILIIKKMANIGFGDISVNH